MAEQGADMLLTPNWPAPAAIGAGMTTRSGGHSAMPYGLANGATEGLNLALHVGDAPRAVALNRQALAAYLPAQPVWLNQIHSNTVVTLDKNSANDSYRVVDADGSVTATSKIVCAVLTADCLPVLFCDRAGRAVGAAHAGWRGLCHGILENVAQAHARAARCNPYEQMAWCGPAIGPAQFEVGRDVLEAFTATALVHEQLATVKAFRPSLTPGKFFCDLQALAKIRLQRVGIDAVYTDPSCTVDDAQRFYSYRRDGVTGRMASLIWIK